MTERDWAERIRRFIARECLPSETKYRVHTQARLPYGVEVTAYGDLQKPQEPRTIAYTTDILITELLDAESWTPRVVIEAKLKSINTHDSITCSDKAAAHKAVHPHLR